MKRHLLTLALFAGMASFANAQSQYLLNESFDNEETVTTTELPEGWSRADAYSGTDNRYRWAVHYDEKASSMTGMHYLCVDAAMFTGEAYKDGQGPRVEKVFTPELSIDDSYILSFQWKAAAASSLESGDYELQVRVLDMATNEEKTIFNSSVEEDVRNSGVLADPYDPTRIWGNWIKNTSTLDLSAYKGKNIKVVFVYNLMHTIGNILYIDEVKVKKGQLATGPEAKVDQSSYDFGSLYVGEKVYSQAFTLTNTGAAGLKVTGFDAPEGIGLSMDTESVNLGKNETAKFQIYYKAALATPAEADATLKTNGGDVKIHVKAAKTIVPDGYSLELFESFPPAGWEAANWSGTGYALEGDKSAFTAGYITNSDLITPRLDLSDAAKPHKVMFTYFSDFTSEDGGTYPNNDLSLWVSSDGGQTWAKSDSIWAADYTQNNQIFNITVDLSKYTSDNVKLMWRNSAVAYDSEYGMPETASYYMDRVLLPNVYGADGVPVAAVLTAPKDGAADIYPKNVTLAWNPAQFAEGYKVYVGKSDKSFDVADGKDVKDATTYTVPALDYQTKYYWKVIPYNSVGDAPTAKVSTFTTQNDMTISSFPWFEGFEGSAVPPLGWYAECTDKARWSANAIEPYDGKVSLSASGRAVGEKAALTTPDIKLPADEEMQVSFWWGNDMGVNLKHDTENVRTNTTTANDGYDAGFFDIFADGEWHQLTMISEPDADNRYWVRERFDLRPYAGKTVQLRWRYEMYDYNRANGISIDNVEITDANATNVVMSTTGWFAGKVNYNKSVASETITLSNFGGNDITVSGVTFDSDNFKSDLAAGDKIEAGKTKNFKVTFSALETAAQDSVTVSGKMSISLSDGSTLSLPVTGIALAKDILYYDFENDATGVAPAGFTVIDEDNRSTIEPVYWDWPNIGNKLSFFVLNDSQCYNSLKGATGHQSLMSIVSNDNQYVAKDWIVSGKLDINENSKFDFDARNWESVTSVLPASRPYISVWVSETSATDISTFTQVGEKKQLPLFDNVAWNHYSYDLSAYAGKSVYVALKSEVDDGLGSFYDNFEFAHVGYQPAGIGTLTADKLANRHVTVYSVSGVKMAEGINALDAVPEGIYVVKAGTQTVKVIKK